MQQYFNHNKPTWWHWLHGNRSWFCSFLIGHFGIIWHLVVYVLITWKTEMYTIIDSKTKVWLLSHTCTSVFLHVPGWRKTNSIRTVSQITHQSGTHDNLPWIISLDSVQTDITLHAHLRVVDYKYVKYHHRCIHIGGVELTTNKDRIWQTG